MGGAGYLSAALHVALYDVIQKYYLSQLGRQVVLVGRGRVYLYSRSDTQGRDHYPLEDEVAGPGDCGVHPQ